MSRIGKMPIAVPAGVTVEVAENNLVTVKGPKGTLSRVFPAEISFSQEDGNIEVKRPDDQKKTRALHGLSRSLLNNMVVGVTDGFEKKLDVVEDGAFKNLHITLKYGADRNDKVITGLKRISKPGLRVYAGKDELPRVLGGLGIAIISTNQGVVTDKKARELQVGGEVLAFIW